MSSFSPCKILAVLLLVNILELGMGQRFRPPMRQPPQSGLGRSRVPPPTCTLDSLMFYQDCRMCVCPRPNRVAKCYRKSCDLRTKDTGQCPAAVLRLQDGNACPLNLVPGGCKVDLDCPGPQLCCFDFCGGTKCADPAPLDLATGQPHKGRGYGYS